MIDLIIGYWEKHRFSVCQSVTGWRQNTGHNWVIPVPDGRKEGTRAPAECRKGMGPPAAANKPGLFPVPVGIGVSAAASYRNSSSAPIGARQIKTERRLPPPSTLALSKVFNRVTTSRRHDQPRCRCKDRIALYLRLTLD